MTRELLYCILYLDIFCIWYLCILYKHHTLQCDSLICSVICMCDIYNLKCCTFVSSSHSKSQLSDSVIHKLCYFFFSLLETERLSYKYVMHSFIIKYFKTTYVHISRLSFGHYNKNSHLKKTQYLFFLSFPLVDMLAQWHSTKTTKSYVDHGIGTMVRKTSLLSKPYCCWVCFTACCGICMFASYTQSPQPAETRHGKRWTCVLAVLDRCSCYGISS